MTSMRTKRLATPKQIPALYPEAFTESSIRWYISNSKTNGMSTCIRRVGKKILLDLDDFESWIKSQQEK